MGFHGAWQSAISKQSSISIIRVYRFIHGQSPNPIFWPITVTFIGKKRLWKGRNGKQKDRYGECAVGEATGNMMHDLFFSFAVETGPLAAARDEKRREEKIIIKWVVVIMEESDVYCLLVYKKQQNHYLWMFVVATLGVFCHN